MIHLILAAFLAGQVCVAPEDQQYKDAQKEAKTISDQMAIYRKDEPNARYEMSRIIKIESDLAALPEDKSAYIAAELKIHDEFNDLAWFDSMLEEVHIS